MSKRDHLYLFDTTLRDGAQTQGVDFSVEDKLRIAQALDRLGIDYVEGGWPGANPTDTELFNAPPALRHAKFVAFGMTKRAGRSAANDPGLAAVLDGRAEVVCLVGKTWDFHVEVALGVTLDENLESIADSVAEIGRRGREAILDAEHFFDGFKANESYALACVEAALKAGARWVTLCDTNGGSLPDEVGRIVGAVTARFGGDRIGIHCHNDTENAVANSLAAVLAGARMVQGTLNGLGERCGNANLVSLIPSFALKPSFRDRVDISIDDGRLAQLTATSRLLDEILNRAPNRHAAYVGASAFAHKGGLHVSAVEKDPKTYEHVPPEAVGNERRILVSDQAGRSNILSRLRDVGIEIAAQDPRIGRLLDDVKQREFEGYTYDGAEASFELLARRALGEVPAYFRVRKYRVEVEGRIDAKGDYRVVTEATVKVEVDGVEFFSVAEGNGPVNALDAALRKDLGKYSAFLDDLRLVDYKVRILNSGTGAVTRVMIESADGQGNRWSTVGVSDNIIDASFSALMDAMAWKLRRDGAPAGNIAPLARAAGGDD